MDLFTSRLKGRKYKYSIYNDTEFIQHPPKKKGV